MTPSEFEKFVVEETEKWAKVIKFAGIKGRCHTFHKFREPRGNGRYWHERDFGDQSVAVGGSGFKIAFSARCARTSSLGH